MWCAFILFNKGNVYTNFPWEKKYGGRSDLSTIFMQVKKINIDTGKIKGYGIRKKIYKI